MKFKKITVILMGTTDTCQYERFENAEWNDSQYGISISPIPGKFEFYPFHNVYKVIAELE